MATPVLLDRDIFHCLAKAIDCRATLAALCQVSKDFHRIFTPDLYSRISLHKYGSDQFRNLADLSKKERLHNTKELILRQSVSRYRENLDADLLDQILKGTPDLELLSFTGSSPYVTRNLYHGHLWETIQSLTTNGPLKTIFWGGGLHIGSLDTCMVFHNLRILKLTGMTRLDSQSVDTLVDTLLTCPLLRSLHLSCNGVRYASDADFRRVRFLKRICDLYAQKIAETGGSLLPLEDLELGLGFQLDNPSNVQSSPLNFYLGGMIDLDRLRGLQIDNVFKENNIDLDRGLKYENETESLQFDDLVNLIDLSTEPESPLCTHYNSSYIVQPALDLEHISFTNFSFALACIIHHIQFTNPSPNLISLQIGGYNCAQPPALTWPGRNRLFSSSHGNHPSPGQVLHKTGYHWHHFDCSDHSVDPDELLEFIRGCSLLRSLACGFSEEMLGHFKVHILPNMVHLHTLMITPYYNDKTSFPVTKISQFTAMIHRTEVQGGAAALQIEEYDQHKYRFKAFRNQSERASKTRG